PWRGTPLDLAGAYCRQSCTGLLPKPAHEFLEAACPDRQFRRGVATSPGSPGPRDFARATGSSTREAGRSDGVDQAVVAAAKGDPAAERDGGDVAEGDCAMHEPPFRDGEDALVSRTDEPPSIAGRKEEC